jgi:glutamyl-tRNA reductase
MTLQLFGINHITAPVEIRERVNFSPDRLRYALKQFVRTDLAQEVVILSTCNRMELYCDSRKEELQESAIIEWLCHYHAISDKTLRKCLYHYTFDEAVRHLLRVACGLDSMILGEPQILGQVKNAYHIAREEGALGKVLSRLFEYSFSVAKRVRTDTAIGSSPVSVAFAAVRLAQQIFGDLSGNTALLIGAGETIELVARHLHENGLRRMIVANRTLGRARQLAKEFSGYAITLDEIPAHLAEADVIISSTASSEPILKVQDVKQAIKARRHEPMFMVDIAVPRDIEPAIAEIEDVYLYTVDDLNEVIQEGLRSRRQAAYQAEEIIDTQVTHFIGWLNSLNAEDTICRLRIQAQNNHHKVVKKAKRMLNNGKSAHEVIDFLAHTLTNSLIHAPCAQLRRASYEGHDELISSAKQLFQLSDEN